MPTDFFPSRDSALLNWAENYKQKLSIHGATVGLTAADITTQQDWCDDIEGQITGVEQAKNNLASLVTGKKSTVKARKDSLREKINQMKAHAAFTQAIGTALDIFSKQADFDADAFKPVAEATVFPGHVRIDFNKDQTDGVNVYARLQGAMPWTLLGRDNFPPYDDTRALANANVPETREYMVRGVVGDTEIGQASDIVSAVFGG